MEILILYHSAVGSTKTIAQMMFDTLQTIANPRIESIEQENVLALINHYTYIMLGFPTYHCSPSKSIQNLINQLPYYESPKYLFAYTTCGLYSANTLRIFAQLALKKNIRTVYSKSYRCPAADGTLIAPGINYFSTFSKNIKQKIQIDLQKAFVHFENKQLSIPRFKFYSILNYPNKLAGHYFKPTIQIFNEKCTHCGLCIKKCPYQCITFDKNKDFVYHKENCEHCYRCIHSCPCSALSLTKRRPVRLQLNKTFFSRKYQDLNH